MVAQNRNATHSVRILHQHIFSFWLFHQQVCDSTHDTPAVRQRHVELGGEVCRPNGCGAENNMTGVVTRVGT